MTLNACAFEAFGVTVAVRSNCAELLDALKTSLPWCVVVPANAAPVPAAAPHEFRLERELSARHVHYAAYSAQERIVRSAHADEAVGRLESMIRLTIAEYAAERVFVHAGVVAWHGQAILLPGRSFAGKSSLVAALLAHGATYYSDEYAVCDMDGSIRPFDKPLRLRTPQGRRTAHGNDLIASRPPIRAGLIVATRFSGKAPGKLREISRGHGILALLDNTVSARRDPASALTVLQKVVEGATLLKGSRGEAAEFAAMLLSRHANW